MISLRGVAADCKPPLPAGSHQAIFSMLDAWKSQDAHVALPIRHTQTLVAVCRHREHRPSMRTLLIAVFLVYSSLSASPLRAGEAAAERPAEGFAGTWRGLLSQGQTTWHIAMTLRGKGKTCTGQLLGWRNLPEAVALQGRPGAPPKDHPLALLYTEAVKVGQNGENVLLDSANLRTLMGGSPGLGPDRFNLTEVAPGVLAGVPLDREGKPGVGRVLLCTQARWDRPTLPAPTPGERSEIACLGGKYHYRVYVPKSYDPGKPAPLLVHSSAGGNSRPWSPELAEEFGWISIGLTESKNGPWDPITENRDAALFDLRQRLNIDWRKVVFGGGSGAARASALAQIMHPDICAGLLLSIAGYDPMNPPPRRVPIFFITGDKDFNLEEVLNCHRQSKQIGRATELIRHPGGHDHGGDENIEKALRWLHGRFDK